MILISVIDWCDVWVKLNGQIADRFNWKSSKLFPRTLPPPPHPTQTPPHPTTTTTTTKPYIKHLHVSYVIFTKYCCLFSDRVSIWKHGSHPLPRRKWEGVSTWLVHCGSTRNHWPTRAYLFPVSESFAGRCTDCNVWNSLLWKVLPGTIRVSSAKHSRVNAKVCVRFSEY